MVIRAKEPEASFPVFIDEGTYLRIEHRIECHRASQGNTRSAWFQDLERRTTVPAAPDSEPYATRISRLLPLDQQLFGLCQSDTSGPMAATRSMTKFEGAAD
jgi:hypothetical protein